MNQRIVIRGPSLDDIHLIDEADPVPRTGEVRLRVRAAGVAFGDVFRRRLAKREFTPGYDVVGVIDAVGNGVDQSWLSKHAACFMPKPGHGGYSQAVVVPKSAIIEIAADLDAIHVVCLGLNYITAHQLLTRITTPHLGEPIFVHGAGGGVGTAMLDLARLLGLKAYGTASAAKHDLVKRYGGIPIDYRSTDFVTELRRLEPNGVRCAYDPIGGRHLSQSLACVAVGGTLVSFGMAGELDRGGAAMLGGFLSFLGLKFRTRNKHVRLYNITINRGSKPSDCRRDWAYLVGLYQERKLDPVVGAVLPLAEARRAHELVEQCATKGKIVLVPSA
jgi:NADPH:quinone reductase-like Zn-dependent oxidoreductase